MSDAREQSEGKTKAPPRRAGAPDETRASTLDLSDAALRELGAQTLALVTEYFARVGELDIFPDGTAGEIARSINAEVLPPAEAVPLEKIIDDCKVIFSKSRNNGSPRFFGYVASPAAPVGAFASLLAAALNQNVTAWRSAPAATEIEKTVVRWLATLVGYGEACGGLLTSGGSMANLNALFVAHRTQFKNDTASSKGLWGAGAPATLYVSDQVHLSVPKAADVLGVGREQVRVVATDEGFRMDVRALREMLAGDAGRGLRPFCVVASAGTVGTGAVDPLTEVARVAAEHRLWFHIDGAYGALARLDPKRRALFDGLELADSLSLDPHKWLYAPVDCGCLLLRDPPQARAAFRATEESYIKVYEEDDAESFAFWDYGVELSRPFRALKVWMMLRYYGARRVAGAIAEDNTLAAYLAERVEAADDFELLAPVTLGVCCFRYVPPDIARALEAAGGDDEERARLIAHLDELNTRVMRAVQRGGRAYLSNASLRGRCALRASITNFRTTRRDIDATLGIIRAAAGEEMKRVKAEGWKDETGRGDTGVRS
ncbi:MAG: pyridoxal phosphate-dependent decarboxylase family protein [Pyrinomonadaceae bacterium]